MRNRWAHWIAAILLWSTLGVLFALPGLSSRSWSHALLGSLAQIWVSDHKLVTRFEVLVKSSKGHASLFRVI
jgi:hypothetical protein